MNREKTIVRTSIVGILGNVVLVVFKAIVGILSNSVSIVTDAINNLTDALSSVITIIGTKISNKKPDLKHPYGYGRIEYLTSVVIACLVLFAGVSALKDSVEQLITPSLPSYETYSLIIIGVAIGVKIALGIFFRVMGKKTASESLKGSGTDALMDAVLSTATLVGALVAYYAKVNIEPYLGIVIGLFILKSGFEILKEGISSLIGSRADNSLTTQLKKIVLSYPEVRGAYDVTLNNYGPERTIGSVHIEVRDDMTATEIHHLTRSIVMDVYQKMHIVLTVGIYASNTKDPKANEIHQYLMQVAAKHPAVIQTHGFYLDKERKLAMFDIVTKFGTDAQKEGTEIVQAMKEKYPEYAWVFNVDLDLSVTNTDEEKKKKKKGK